MFKRLLIIFFLLGPTMAYGESINIDPSNAKEYGVTIDEITIKNGDAWCYPGKAVKFALPQEVKGHEILNTRLYVDNGMFDVILGVSLANTTKEKPGYICLKKELMMKATVAASYGYDKCEGSIHSYILKLKDFINTKP